MRSDEYNSLNITNEKDGISTFEFGKFQDTEITSFSDNRTNIRDEVNDTKVSNGQNNKQEEQKEQKKQEERQEQNNQNKQSQEDLHEEINSGSSSSSSASSSGASSSTGASSGAASSTASGAAASAGATVATVASASVIAVSTLAAVVGVNVFIKAKCNIQFIEPSPFSISYALELTETENDDFKLVLENKDLNFEESKELTEGINKGEFFDLEPNRTYKFSVIDVTQSNFVIHTEDVKTLEHLVPTKELIGIEISDYRTEFIVGDEFVFGGTCIANYSDGTSEQVVPTFSQTDMSSAGEKEIIVTYTEDSITVSQKYNIVINEVIPERKLTGITIKDYQTNFTAGDEFVFGGSCLAHYSDDTSQEVVPTFSSVDMSIAGEKEVTVSYTEDSITVSEKYNIIVSEAKILESIELVDYKNTFEIDEEFEFTGVCYAIYSDGSRQQVIPTFIGSTDTSSPGEKQVYVLYRENKKQAEAYCYITVVGNGKLQSISLYNQTKEFAVGSEFVFDGECYAYYSASDPALVEPTSVSTPDMTTLGTQEITVTYEENGVSVSAAYTITISENRLLNLEVSDYTTEYLVGDIYEFDGTCTVYYLADPKQGVEVEPSFVECNGETLNTKGEIVLVVEYRSSDTDYVSAHIVINVGERILTGIDYEPNKTFFGKGETFDSSGTCYAYYNNDEENAVVVEPTSISEPNMYQEGEQQVIVTYTEGDVTQECTYTITIEDSISSVAWDGTLYRNKDGNLLISYTVAYSKNYDYDSFYLILSRDGDSGEAYEFVLPVGDGLITTPLENFSLPSDSSNIFNYQFYYLSNPDDIDSKVFVQGGEIPINVMDAPAISEVSWDGLISTVDNSIAYLVSYDGEFAKINGFEMIIQHYDLDTGEPDGDEETYSLVLNGDESCSAILTGFNPVIGDSYLVNYRYIDPLDGASYINVYPDPIILRIKDADDPAIISAVDWDFTINPDTMGIDYAVSYSDPNKTLDGTITLELYDDTLGGSSQKFVLNINENSAFLTGFEWVEGHSYHYEFTYLKPGDQQIWTISSGSTVISSNKQEDPGYVTGVTWNGSVDLNNNNSINYSCLYYDPNGKISTVILAINEKSPTGDIIQPTLFNLPLTATQFNLSAITFEQGKTYEYSFSYLNPNNPEEKISLSSGELTIPITRTLESITVEEYTDEYVVNSVVSFDGICKAYYSDNPNEGITIDNSLLVVTPPSDMSSPGNKQVFVSYTEDEKTVETFYWITVTEEQSSDPKITRIEFEPEQTVYEVDDDFNPNGTCTVYYSDDLSGPGNSDYLDFTNYDMAKVGQQEVTVTYADDEHEPVSTTFFITVNDPAQTGSNARISDVTLSSEISPTNGQLQLGYIVTFEGSSIEFMGVTLYMSLDPIVENEVTEVTINVPQVSGEMSYVSIDNISEFDGQTVYYYVTYSVSGDESGLYYAGDNQTEKTIQSVYISMN